MPANYKKLLSEKSFLKVQARARALTGTNLVGIFYTDKELIFKTLSGTDHKTIWTQRVVVDQLTLDNVRQYRPVDVAKIIKKSTLKIHCGCPAFLFWGYKYIAWRKGYGLEKETRRPIVRNPQQQGFVCKHLHLVMTVLPFLAPTIAKKFKGALKSDVQKELEKYPTPEGIDENDSEVEELVEDLNV